MANAEDPIFMESYLEHAISVVDHAKLIPKAMFKQRKGAMLIAARKGAFLVSSTLGSGVLVPHNSDGMWGLPMAVTLDGCGLGATFGLTNQGVIIIVSRFNMEHLLEGRGETRLGLDSRFTCGACTLMYGSTGGGRGGDAAVSTDAGLGSSFIYTFNKGALVNAEVTDTMIKAATEVSASACGGNATCKQIVDGKVPTPDGKQGDMIKSLHEKLAAHAK